MSQANSNKDKSSSNRIARHLVEHTDHLKELDTTPLALAEIQALTLALTNTQAANAECYEAKLARIKAEYLIALSVKAKLRGQEVMIKAASFNYAGLITETVADTFVVMSGAKYVFDTGEFTGDWADAQPVPSGEWHIMLDAIESFGIMR